MLAWCGTRRHALLHRARRSLATSCAYSPLEFSWRYDARQPALGGVGRQRLVRAWLRRLDDVVAGRAAEHQQVEQRVGAQAVGAVHATQAHSPTAYKPLTTTPDCRRLRVDDLAVDVGRDAAHLVVDGRHHGIGSLVMSTLANLWPISNARQALQDGLGSQVGQVEHHVVPFGPQPRPSDLLVHAARDTSRAAPDPSASAQRSMKRSPLLVAQDRRLRRGSLRSAARPPGNAGRVELPELHVLQRDAGAPPCRQPSPVQMKALVDAEIDARRRRRWRTARDLGLGTDARSSPVSISSAVTPTTSPSASRIRSSAIHSTKNWRCCARSAGTACAASRGRCGRPRRRRAAPASP